MPLLASAQATPHKNGINLEFSLNDFLNTNPVRLSTPNDLGILKASTRSQLREAHLDILLSGKSKFSYGVSASYSELNTQLSFDISEIPTQFEVLFYHYPLSLYRKRIGLGPILIYQYGRWMGKLRLGVYKTLTRSYKNNSHQKCYFVNYTLKYFRVS
jgi:hypothetical protein